jgi:hypothetical protein
MALKSTLALAGDDAVVPAAEVFAFASELISILLIMVG